MSTIHKTTADNADIIKAALDCARPKRGEKRGTFPRFNVRADDVTVNCKDEKALIRELGNFVSGEVCYVFRNGGYGATITFDKPAWWTPRIELATHASA